MDIYRYFTSEYRGQTFPVTDFGLSDGPSKKEPAKLLFESCLRLRFFGVLCCLVVLSSWCDGWPSLVIVLPCCACLVFLRLVVLLDVIVLSCGCLVFLCLVVVLLAALVLSSCDWLSCLVFL